MMVRSDQGRFRYVAIQELAIRSRTRVPSTEEKDPTMPAVTTLRPMQPRYLVESVKLLSQ